MYLDADLWDLLKAAAPHELTTFQRDEMLLNNPKPGDFVLTAESLHDQIIREWFQREDKRKYTDLVELRRRKAEEADAEWQSTLSGPGTPPG